MHQDIFSSCKSQKRRVYDVCIIPLERKHPFFVDDTPREKVATYCCAAVLLFADVFTEIDFAWQNFLCRYLEPTTAVCVVYEQRAVMTHHDLLQLQRLLDWFAVGSFKLLCNIIACYLAHCRRLAVVVFPTQTSPFSNVQTPHILTRCYDVRRTQYLWVRD